MALVALGTDRMFFGAAASGPETASASPITAALQNKSAATTDIDAPLEKDDPTAATSLAQRLTQLARHQPGQLKGHRDAFRPSNEWVGVDGSGSDLPTDANRFRKTHKLMALMPKNRRPFAMVDGQTVFVGQKLDGFTLVAVRSQSAVFESIGGRVELKMGGEARSR